MTYKKFEYLLNQYGVKDCIEEVDYNVYRDIYQVLEINLAKDDIFRIRKMLREYRTFINMMTEKANVYQALYLLRLQDPTWKVVTQAGWRYMLTNDAKQITYFDQHRMSIHDLMKDRDGRKTLWIGLTRK